MRTFSETPMLGTPTFVRISGHARDESANPVSRAQRLYDVHGLLLQTTMSNASTGGYEFTVAGNHNDRFDVIGVPGPGEKAPMANAVIGVII